MPHKSPPPGSWQVHDTTVGKRLGTRDAEALLEHTANLGETMAALFETCSASGEICGTLSPEPMRALEGLPVRIYSPYQSI